MQKLEIYEIRKDIEKIIRSVVSSCLTSPFTRVVSRMGCAPISSDVTIHGPMLPEASKFLPCVTLNLPCRSQSRTLPSLHSVTPAM